MNTPSRLILPAAWLLLFAACARQADDAPAAPRLLFSEGRYPKVVEVDGTFYTLLQAPASDAITIRTASSLDSIPLAEPLTILQGSDHGMTNIWSPEMVRIDGKWYLYFEADDGNTDNHQIYVLENPSADPLKGHWTLHGPVITNAEWNFGIHPSAVVVDGRQYLFWSGWEHRRAESETQCIFMAEMENPWTLKSERVLISSPDYEWERQWVNADGSRTAYPIFVNENPEPVLSPDGRKLVVAYSASGIWTPYNVMGLIYADAKSDLTDPASWHKMAEPQFANYTDGSDSTAVYSTSNVSVVNTSAGDSYLFYQGKDNADGHESSRIYVKEIGWNQESLPEMGSPL